jgi:lipopolysaccharide/colanic/teichoic acid biosynthesis glycosyltransferase
MRAQGAYDPVKRVIDFVVGSLALAILSPLLAAIAALVWLRLGSPVFFRQIRPGLGERPFTLIKFRTMTDARDARGSLLPDDRRLLPLGRFLRSASLDELPELVNVLRGEMSLVGPRPLLMEYLPLYSARQRRRHEVRPGISGLAQVSGRNLLSWPRKLEMDVAYVEHRSLWLDLKIIAKTLVGVLGRQGITPLDMQTMPPFRGEGRDG